MVFYLFYNIKKIAELRFMKIYHVSETTPGENGESVLLTCHKIKSYCYSRDLIDDQHQKNSQTQFPFQTE